MNEERPDYSLTKWLGLIGAGSLVAAGKARAEADSGASAAPEMKLVRHFQVNEADYMKPPLEDQLFEPDENPAATGSGRSVVGTACTCNTVCTCVPVTTCSCNTVCTCNTVNSSYGVQSLPSRGRSRSFHGGGGGGYGGYYAPCF